MYLFKQSRPDIQLPVSFFTPRVNKINNNDWKKLGKSVDTCRRPYISPLISRLAASRSSSGTCAISISSAVDVIF